MHKKHSTFRTWLASLAMVSLVASGAVVLSPAASASQVAAPLDFITDWELAGLTEGSIHVFDDINIAGDKAKVTIVDLVNAKSDNEKTEPVWDLFWSGWTEKPVQPGGQTYGLRTRYSFNGGAWVYSPTLASTALGYSETDLQLTGLQGALYVEQYRFEIVAYNSTSANPAQPEGIGLKRLDWHSVVGFNSGTDTLDARYEFEIVTPDLNVYDRLDSWEESGDVDRDYLRSNIITQVDNQETSVTVKIEFFESDGTTVKVFPYLSANLYDLDNSQFVSFDNVSSYQLQSDNNVQSVTETSPGTWRFLAKVDNTTGSNSYTKGRVMVNFENVSSFQYQFGVIASGSTNNHSMELDVSEGRGDDVVPWTLTTAGVAPIALVSAPPASTSTPTSAAPAVTLISPLAIASVPKNRNVSLFGANFDKVTEVFVGGRKLTILKQTANQIDIRLPRGFSGLVDLELKSTLNNVLSTKHFNYGGVAASATRKAELIVGGFAHNSRVLTPRMRNRIDRWLERNSDLGTLTCTGFTSLPRRTTDVALSTNRGKTACSYSESQRSEIESSVSQGIEDPRPGSNVRRVRLVLTQ